jgi:hypothetical protein
MLDDPHLRLRGHGLTQGRLAGGSSDHSCESQTLD